MPREGGDLHVDECDGGDGDLQVPAGGGGRASNGAQVVDNLSHEEWIQVILPSPRLELDLAALSKSRECK
ncbi:hypothetical protein ZIOFF_048186 [Zingiber officinale]|uniref:Uncharacterized protein n=1 Tax=Zingiber officinale TaxID=94328 RepID=A0A8J5FSW2_ZINOF|nr:hypothetical protein ZIOFF_048186 [Zingiber officinale]